MNKKIAIEFAFSSFYNFCAYCIGRNNIRFKIKQKKYKTNKK